MSKAAALILALAVTTGLAAPAAAQSAERIAAFLAVVEELGCVVNDANNLIVLDRLNMTQAEGTRIVTQLMADGRAVPQDDDLRITTGACK